MLNVIKVFAAFIFHCSAGVQPRLDVIGFVKPAKCQNRISIVSNSDWKLFVVNVDFAQFFNQALRRDVVVVVISAPRVTTAIIKFTHVKRVFAQCGLGPRTEQWNTVNCNSNCARTRADCRR